MLKRYVVKGHSMEPSFHDGDRLIFSSFFFNLKKGDVMVFGEGNRDYLKRIIEENGENYTVAGDNVNHTGKHNVNRSQVKGKFLLKY